MSKALWPVHRQGQGRGQDSACAVGWLLRMKGLLEAAGVVSVKDELDLGANTISQDIRGFLTAHKLTGEKPIQLGKRRMLVVAEAQAIKQSFETYLPERININCQRWLITLV